MKRQKTKLISAPTVANLPPTIDLICPLCKLTLDKDDTYSGYRQGEDYKLGKYPKWAYPEGNDVSAHLINFHRMPQEFSKMFAVGLVMGKFLKANPQFELLLPITEGVIVTNNADHPDP
jgi:hypothetical protein